METKADVFYELPTPKSSVTPRHSVLRQRVLHIPVVEEVVQKGPAFLYPEDDGTHETIVVPQDELDVIRDEMNKPKFQLSEWFATAISGNDIMSSIMYSAGIVVVKGGNLAPVCFAIVSFVLYLYRFIYSEAVMAVPLNGGSYNLLLNTTSKKVAAVAACLSTLCYLATSVVSATTSSYYLKTSVPDLPVNGVSIALLGLFALLMLLGIRESSMTAFIIFAHHMVCLTVLAVVCLVYAIKNPRVIHDNYVGMPYPSVDFVGSQIDGNFFTAIFFGFSEAMLGVTGFETSANFVEEQKPGVFPKTLRVSFVVSLRIESCPIFFFVVATSLVLILDSDATTLGGVYTYSFLSLMFLFGAACILLKLKRHDIPRTITAPWHACFLGIPLVTCGIVGNLLGDPKTLLYFALYFIFVATIVFVMLERVFVLRVLVAFVNMFVKEKVKDQVDPPVMDVEVNAAVVQTVPDTNAKLLERDGDHVAMLTRAIKEINSKPIVFFVKQANMTILNKAILYIRRNEITHNVRFVHVYQAETPHALETVANLREMVTLMETLYPKLKIDFYAIVAPFEPATVEWISKKYDITTKLMFIKAPSTISVHKISSYGIMWQIQVSI
ncbi:hypothetical protein LEN26_008458 [Aphanomyces euteiches]|nr:hypothetical protein AeMF1_009503 [Aphanomyces euteiches]KAH9130530.1 hypothetical protein LEN26_008458 [Aphanomyces euteiches]KAH9193217.1 hypothetical protein AeNC1_004802 [Aphanomyces euteiches]